MALIQGELDTFGPLQRGEALTPRDLALLESNVKRAVQVTSPSPSAHPYLHPHPNVKRAVTITLPLHRHRSPLTLTLTLSP